jgi:4-diphosphocytidyl-2-C-methyl-D-erythritol kinase
VNRTARVSAPAKVNLRLSVLGRRADGYHDIDTLFQAIDLADDLVVRLGGEGIRLRVSGADVGPEEENLAYRAAARFAQDFGLRDGIDIELTKRIPAGAGLGGGSADAAGTLLALAALTGVPRSERRLLDAAASIGSDVAFFLGESALARGRGRGERLEPLPALPVADLVVVSPPVHVSTAEAYAALTASRAGAPLGSVDFETPRTWNDVAVQATNDFQSLIAARHPEVARALESLGSAGAKFTLMCGSGSSVFGVFADRAAAETAAAKLDWPSRATRTLTRLPEPTPH